MENKIIYSWEWQHLEHIEKLSQLQQEKDPRAKDCGGFTKAQIGMLWKNQDTVHDDATQKLNKDLDLFYELAASFSSPYLFETIIMPSYTHLITYKRNRKDLLVCELEDICASTYSKEYYYPCNKKDVFKELIKEIDTTCVQAVINIANLYHCKLDEINIKIEKVIKDIDQKTNTIEPKIVVFPPELINPTTCAIKLTDNLKIITENLSERNYTTFISRLIPENKVLVGTKSKNRFNSYVFCPYMLMCENITKNKVMMCIGRKLLREGSNYYGSITVD